MATGTKNDPIPVTMLQTKDGKYYTLGVNVTGTTTSNQYSPLTKEEFQGGISTIQRVVTAKDLKQTMDANYSQIQHTHSISQIPNLQTTLDGKAEANHSHPLNTLRGYLDWRQINQPTFMTTVNITSFAPGVTPDPGWTQTRATKIAGKLVFLEGLVRGSGNPGTLCYLPEGFRPLTNCVHTAGSSSRSSQVYIYSSGEIAAIDNYGGYLSLNGIVFTV